MAERLGATIDIERNAVWGFWTACAEAPDQHVWCSDDIHELVSRGDTAGDAWADLVDRMGYGIRPCPYLLLGCEWCQPEE